jgi:hypothetical protein
VAAVLTVAAAAACTSTPQPPGIEVARGHCGITTLAGDVATLRTALASGDRQKSRQAWLVAQTAYNRLGAGYDTFGDAHYDEH